MVYLASFTSLHCTVTAKFFAIIGTATKNLHENFFSEVLIFLDDSFPREHTTGFYVAWHYRAKI